MNIWGVIQNCLILVRKTELLTLVTYEGGTMRKSIWATHVLTVWVLIHGLMYAYGLFNIFSDISVGGIHWPLGPLPYIVLIVVGIWLYKKKKGARWVATGMLAWSTSGVVKMFLMRVFGSWPLEYITGNQIVTLGYLLVNGTCFVYLWWNKEGNPYSKSTNVGQVLEAEAED